MIVFSIKLYAWENAFIRKILFVRNEQELKMLRKIGIVTVCQTYTIQHIQRADHFRSRSIQLCGQAFPVCFDYQIGVYALIVVSVLVAFSSFATAALVSDAPLTSDKIFPAISLFMLLQFPLAMVRELSLHAENSAEISSSSVWLRRTSSKPSSPLTVFRRS